MKVRSAKRNMIALIVTAAVYLLVALLNKAGIIRGYYLQLIMISCINVCMTVSLNLVNGFTGQFSVGHAGFMAIGSYVSGYLTTQVIPQASIPAALQTPVFILALLAGGLVAGIAGALIGLPTLRLRGDYLAIVTLGFGEIIRAIIRLIPAVGGAKGMSGIPKYSNLLIVLIVTVVIVVLCRNLVNSAQGRACISIRENEIAASCLGVNTFKYKMMVFIVAAAMAGVAGGLYAHALCYTQPDLYSFNKSCDYLVFLYAGGTASLTGSVLSAFL
ncbi:MAG: branched-chain amino acid ABC transporter permease [Lachnospiraceae bacterium]